MPNQSQNEKDVVQGRMAGERSKVRVAMRVAEQERHSVVVPDRATERR